MSGGLPCMGSSGSTGRWRDATQGVHRDIHGVADHDVRFAPHDEAGCRDGVGDDLQELSRPNPPGFVDELTSPEAAEGMRVERVALDQERLETRRRRLAWARTRSDDELAARSVAASFASPRHGVAVMVQVGGGVSVGEAEREVGDADREPLVGVEGAEPHARLAVGALHIRAHVDLTEVPHVGEA